MRKVSIIVPAFNVESYLERCLTSISNQTYKNIEVIIVNDGSSDNTEKVALNFIKNHPNFKYYKKENGGVASARNLGLDVASGDYISFIDADDWINNEYIENLVNNIKENDSFCMANELDRYGSSLIKKYIIDKETAPLFKNPSVDLRLFNKKYIDELNLRFQNTTMGEDLSFSAKIYIYNSNLSMSDNCIYYYFMNDSSLTHTYNKHVYSIIDAVEDIEDFTRNLNKFKEFESTLEYINICHILMGLMINASKLDTFDEKEIDNIIDYVEKKYPNWSNNKNIKYLKDSDIEYLKNLKNRDYSKIKDYLSNH